jgi:hypothetical protein
LAELSSAISTRGNRRGRGPRTPGAAWCISGLCALKGADEAARVGEVAGGQKRARSGIGIDGGAEGGKAARLEEGGPTGAHGGIGRRSVEAEEQSADVKAGTAGDDELRRVTCEIGDRR